jgi:hypothetical protein
MTVVLGESGIGAGFRVKDGGVCPNKTGQETDALSAATTYLPDRRPTRDG